MLSRRQVAIGPIRQFNRESAFEWTLSLNRQPSLRKRLAGTGYNGQIAQTYRLLITPFLSGNSFKAKASRA